MDGKFIPRSGGRERVSDFLVSAAVGAYGPFTGVVSKLEDR